MPSGTEVLLDLVRAAQELLDPGRLRLRPGRRHAGRWSAAGAWGCGVARPGTAGTLHTIPFVTDHHSVPQSEAGAA